MQQQVEAGSQLSGADIVHKGPFRRRAHDPVQVVFGKADFGSDFVQRQFPAYVMLDKVGCGSYVVYPFVLHGRAGLLVLSKIDSFLTASVQYNNRVNEKVRVGVVIHEFT